MRTARRGAMINGCLLLFASLIIIVTLGPRLASLPPFHVVLATVALMFAAVLSRTPDTGWQVGALLAIGVPALLSTIYAYAAHPGADLMSGTSGLLYVSGTAIFVLTCIVQSVRGNGDPTTESNSKESS